MEQRVAAALIHLKSLGYKAAAAMDKARPHIDMARKQFEALKAKAQPYHLDLLFMAFVGLVLMMMGSLFPTMVLSYEVRTKKATLGVIRPRESCVLQMQTHRTGPYDLTSGLRCLHAQTAHASNSPP